MGGVRRALLCGLTRQQLRHILDPHGLSEAELEDILTPWEDPACSGPHLPRGEPDSINAVLAVTSMEVKSMEESPFHEVGKLFPADVPPLTTVCGDTPVAQALELMMEHRYSQLPVVEGDELRGMFSLWSLARHITQMSEVEVHDLPVEDVMDRNVATTKVTDSLSRLLQLLEDYESVLVTSPQGLQAILTPVDALQYFYRVAHPFVLLQEIELGLRSLINSCLSEVELTEAIAEALGHCYDDGESPETLEDMTVMDYKMLITCKRNWPRFAKHLGQNKALVNARLEKLRRMRNALLHFRQDPQQLAVSEYEWLVDMRGWVIDKLQRCEAAKRGERDAETVS